MDGKFTTTQWSLVQAAADSANPESQQALSDLCQRYWQPVYAFVRYSGHDAEAARELTQGFFTRLLDKKYVKSARPERGRFRSFLLASVKHYLSNEQSRERAQKRGGGVVPLSLDFDTIEIGFDSALTEQHTPETLFDKRWALSVLKRAMGRLERQMQETGREEQYRRLQPFLTGEGLGTPYRDLAASLELSESAVKVSIHRMRRRLGKLLREEVAQTLSDERLLDEEMSFLLNALSS